VEEKGYDAIAACLRRLDLKGRAPSGPDEHGLTNMAKRFNELTATQVAGTQPELALVDCRRVRPAGASHGCLRNFETGIKRPTRS